MGTGEDTVIVPARSRRETNDVPVTLATNGVPYAMDWLKGRLQEVGMTPAAFARALGLPKARAYEMQRGDRRLQPNEIGPAARALKMTEAELVARLEGRPVTSSHEIDISGRQPLRQGDTPPAPLVIYRTAPIDRGRQGDFMVFAIKIGETERPEFLRFSERAFSAKVLDDRNKPAYRSRDLVLVDPDSPPIEGEDCFFTSDLNATDGSPGVVACLVLHTGKAWITRQYNIKGERELSKAEFPHAWPIVGRYNRR